MCVFLIILLFFRVNASSNVVFAFVVVSCSFVNNFIFCVCLNSLFSVVMIIIFLSLFFKLMNFCFFFVFGYIFRSAFCVVVNFNLL